MAKPQMSLRTLLYGMISAQVVVALVFWLDYSSPVKSAVLLCAVYILGIGGAYCLARDRQIQGQSLVGCGWKRGSGPVVGPAGQAHRR